MPEHSIFTYHLAPPRQNQNKSNRISLSISVLPPHISKSPPTIPPFPRLPPIKKLFDSIKDKVQAAINVNVFIYSILHHLLSFIKSLCALSNALGLSRSTLRSRFLNSESVNVTALLFFRYHL